MTVGEAKTEVDRLLFAAFGSEEEGISEFERRLLYLDYSESGYAYREIRRLAIAQTVSENPDNEVE